MSIILSHLHSFQQDWNKKSFHPMMEANKMSFFSIYVALSIAIKVQNVRKVKPQSPFSASIGLECPYGEKKGFFFLNWIGACGIAIHVLVCMYVCIDE